MPIISILSLLLAILFFSFSLWFITEKKRFQTRLNNNEIYKIEAVCVDYQKGYNPSVGTVYYPIYQYYINGVIQRYRSTVASDMKRYKLGENVNLYWNVKTGEIQENLANANAFRAIIFSILGLLFCIIALIVFFI